MNGALGHTPKLPRSRLPAYPVSVSKRYLQLLAVVVLLFATLTPLANCFDTWDKGPAAAPANDTELHVTALFVGAGFLLVLPRLVRPFLLIAAMVGKADQPSAPFLHCFSVHRATPAPSASPPATPLRI